MPANNGSLLPSGDDGAGARRPELVVVVAPAGQPAPSELFQRLSGHEATQDEIAVPAAPVNAALSGLLAIEASLVRVIDMPIGSSLLAVARKPAHSTATV